MTRPKIALLTAAWKRGPPAFARQAIVTARDTLWSKRFLLFRMKAENNNLPEMPEIPLLTFRRISDWEELSPATLDMLRAEQYALAWGSFEWLDQLQYGLWVAEIDGELAGMKWWRHRNQCDGYEEVISDGMELDWHTTVLPSFRGRRLYERIMFSMMNYRISTGVQSFIAHTRDYNTTSIRMFDRMKWEYIGVLTENKISGSRHWKIHS